MKLLFVFTGGTIGSVSNGVHIGLGKNGRRRLLSAYEEKWGIDFDYEEIEPYSVLSENLEARHLASLITALQGARSGTKAGRVHDASETEAGRRQDASEVEPGRTYDGVIVTHGTDTLQYTAAALGYALGNTGIPVCLVGANRPVEDPRSNALTNLRAAVEWIRGGFGSGVHVVYHNPGDRGVTVHRGTRLIASQAYSECFSSAEEIPVGWMSIQSPRKDGPAGRMRIPLRQEDAPAERGVRATGRKARSAGRRMPVFAENTLYAERADEIPVLMPGDVMPVAEEEGKITEALKDAGRRIVRIFPYPGMRYPRIPEGITDVLHESFHSGTVRTEGAETEAFFGSLRERGIRVWLTGAAQGAAYESTKKFAPYGIRVLPEMSPVAAYMKLWLIHACGREPKKEMDKSLGGDIIR